MAEPIYTIAAGVVGLGALHGADPGHGWPLAASYATRQAKPYWAALTAGLLLGVGHLISSMAVVLAFYGLKAWFQLDQLGWIDQIAGALLIALGLWEWRQSHHGHDHGHSDDQQTDNRGLYAIVMAAFFLGFAHEEEFQIIALCAGSELCLELMFGYATTVLLVITALTVLVVAGFERWRHRIEFIEPYLPRATAAILIVMGLVFVSGLI